MFCIFFFLKHAEHKKRLTKILFLKDCRLNSKQQTITCMYNMSMI